MKGMLVSISPPKKTFASLGEEKNGLVIVGWLWLW
jgi:hypothetical protein